MEPSPYSSPAVSILIVDDDQVTRKVTGLMISRKFPYNPVQTAAGGRNGLELFKKYSPGIVITDIQMPEMDGLEMAAAIKAIRADTKFIVLTAYCSTNYKEKCEAIGCYDFLLKPIEFDKLYAMVEKCLVSATEEQRG